MKAAGIIAAGWGERLGQKIPKALTPVAGRVLIDFVLDGLEAAGVTDVVCIVNESARAVPDHVARQRRSLKIDWIIQTTPSSMHSFLIVLERLARFGQKSYLMSTVDGVCPPETYRQFSQACELFEDADVCLGLTDLIDDEKPLRVAMSGNEGTGIMPARLEDNPAAFEIVAMTNTGFDSTYITSGFYQVSPQILQLKEESLGKGFTALRQFLGHLLKYGFRFYGVPLPAVVDVDRPQDVATAEKFLAGSKS